MSDHQKGVKRPQSWNVLWAEALCEQDVELTVEKKTYQNRVELFGCIASATAQK